MYTKNLFAVIHVITTRSFAVVFQAIFLRTFVFSIYEVFQDKTSKHQFQHVHFQHRSSCNMISLATPVNMVEGWLYGNSNSVCLSALVESVTGVCDVHILVSEAG